MSLQDQVVDAYRTNTALVLEGEVLRASGTRTVVLAQANATANLQGAVGVSGSLRVGLGGPVNVVVSGRARVRCVTGLVLAAGNTLWVSASVAGAATNVKPANALPIGVVKDPTGYSASNPYVVADIAIPAETPTSTVAADFLFQTVADMAAFDMTGLPNGVVGDVVTLRRKFIYNQTSVAANDPDNYDVVTATGGGRWFDTGDANLSWEYENVAAGTASWVIDPVAGNNENVGSSAAPLKTAKELRKRFHDLTIDAFETWSIEIRNNLADTDPLVIAGTRHYTMTQTGAIQITAPRTLAAFGTILGVTNLNHNTAPNGQVATVTLSANIDAHVGKYIRFLSVGAFVASCFVAKALGANTYVLSTPTDENGLTFPAVNNIVNLTIGNAFEVYDFKTAPDVIIDAPEWELGVTAVDLRLTSVAGAGFVHGRVVMSMNFVGCWINGSIYGTLRQSYQFTNCHTVAFGPSFGIQGGSLLFSSGLHTISATGFSDTQYQFAAPDIGERGKVAFNRYPMFLGTAISLTNVDVNLLFSQHNGICFLDGPALPLMDVGQFVNGTFDAIWGTGNSGATAGIRFTGRDSRLYLRATPIVDAPPGVQLVFNATTVPATPAINGMFTDTTLNNIVDEDGNGITGLGGRTVPHAIRGFNAGGATALAGEVMRYLGATNAITRAQANSASGAAKVVGVLLTTVANNAHALIADTGHPRGIYDASGPTGGAVAYLSPSVAGRMTVNVPLATNSAQKLRLGIPGSPSGGTTARTAWRPENLAVNADGNP